MRFEQDFLMRQIQYLTQVLQQIVFRKKQNKPQEAIEEIEHALDEINRDQSNKFSELTLNETNGIFVKSGRYYSQLAIAVADLLFEQGKLQREQSYSTAVHSHQQALLLYKKALQEKDAAVPINIAEKIQSIESRLTDEQQEEVAQALP